MDKGTLQNIKDSDKETYSQFYIDYFKKFYNYGRKLTTNHSLIEDSIQEVFLDIWSKKEKLAEIASISSYFFSSFRYILFKNIKNSDRIIHNKDFESEPEFSIDYIMINKEVSHQQQQKLQSALKSLTAHQREAIFFRFYEGLSYEEVASILNISVKATYKIIARSLSALKESMLIPLGTLSILLRLKTMF